MGLLSCSKDPAMEVGECGGSTHGGAKRAPSLRMQPWEGHVFADAAMGGTGICLLPVRVWFTCTQAGACMGRVQHCSGAWGGVGGAHVYSGAINWGLRWFWHEVRLRAVQF